MLVGTSSPFIVSLRALNFIRVYPLRQKNVCFFHFQSVLRSLLVALVLSGSAYHMVKVIEEGITEIDISEDLYIVVGGSAIWLVTAFFHIFSKDWMSFIDQLINFDEYGLPANFHQIVKRGNLVSKIGQWYVLLASISYYGAGQAQRSTCYKVKEEKNTELLICGMFFPMWLPCHVHYSILVFLYIISFSLAVITILGGACITIITWEVSEVIGCHIDHLNQTFKDIILIKDKSLLQEKFQNWIYYHNHIIRLMERLSKLVKQSVGHAVYMSAIVCGCVLNVAVGTKPICGMLFLCGWMVSLFFMCKAGQTIIDKSLSVADAVYDSEWYNLDTKLQKDVMFIMQRGQRPNSLETFPFGIMDYSLYIMIIQASYSYLTLLRNSVRT